MDGEWMVNEKCNTTTAGNKDEHVVHACNNAAVIITHQIMFKCFVFVVLTNISHNNASLEKSFTHKFVAIKIIVKFTK